MKRSTELQRRLLAWLLCAGMVFAMLPVAALADADSDEPVPGETTEFVATIPESTAPRETIPQETVPQETVPQETAPQETVPQETVPQETVPQETAPQDTVPQETIPQETAPQETIPQETIPETCEEVMLLSGDLELPVELTPPEVIRQPGSYTSDTDDNLYPTDYTTQQTPGDLWFQFQIENVGASYRLQMYYTPTGSYDDAEVADGVTCTEQAVTEGETVTQITCVARWDEGVTYSAGTHGFFVGITLYCPEDPDVAEVTGFTDPVMLTVTEAETETSPWEGTGTQEDPYVVASYEGLETLRQQNALGETFSGVYFALVGELELPPDWEPIGTQSARFGGTLDGDAFGSGSCATIVVAEGGLPLLGYVQGAQVRNLNIYGRQIAGYGLVNNFVGVGLSGSAIVIDHVTILSGTQILKSGLLGAYITTNRYAGVSAGFVATIRNCTVEEGVVIGYNKDQSMIGSIAGRMQGTVENCVSYATVYGVNYAGGIIGTRDNALGNCIVTGCTFGGTVEASGDHAGGIVGGGYENSTAPNGIRVTITNNTATGTISGGDKVGGILGGDSYVAQAWNAYSLRSNRFTGTVSATGSYIGGIIGFYDSLNIFDDIADNTYSATCGASQGIGFVKYLDTSCENPTVPEGTVAFNTQNGVEDCPTVTGCAWKKKHNRTDDPLGADAEALCKKLEDAKPVAPTCYELKVSGSYKTKYTAGEELDLSGIRLTACWTDGSTTQPELSDVTLSGYNKNQTGSQTVTIAYGTVKAQITVTVSPKSTKITVSVTILGDSNHGDTTTPHGLARGGLITWASNAKLEADASETVWDVLSRLAEENGVTIQASYSAKYNSYYIEAVNGLGEFDNGSNSGWMYTVNGTHPEVGVSARYVKKGDVIVLHYTDDYNYEEGGIYYNQSQQTKDAAYVDGLIAAIGTVRYTDACKKKIDAARAAYKALSGEEQAKVTKLAQLEAAEESYQELKQQEDAAKAKTVTELIGKIGSPVTTGDKSAINAARTAYNKLTADQKALVTNYAVLTRAETAYANLTATDADKAAAQEVMQRIASAQTQEEFLAAREAYDALTDLQKLLVENYELLESGEARLATQSSGDKVEDVYITTGDYITALGAPAVGTIGGEWMVIGLARSGREIPGSGEYYSGVEAYVREHIDENGRLHKAKSTDNSRLILALTAMGKDVRNVAGHDLLQGLSSMEFVKKQGNNGPIWALIALNSGNYPAPEGDVTRQGLLDEILSVQTSDGGWAISGDEADSDMTGMALQALAPYYGSDPAVTQAVDRAIDRLSQMQGEDGGYSTFSGNGKVATSESTAQVVVALSALGIDADTDPRFVKDGGSALDALLRYYVTGGGFRHIADGELDGMATEQGYYALTAYCRLLERKTSLYDMTDVVDLGGDGETLTAAPVLTQSAAASREAPEPEENSLPWFVPVLTLILGVGLGMGGTLAVVLVAPKLKKKP